MRFFFLSLLHSSLWSLIFLVLIPSLFVDFKLSTFPLLHIGVVFVLFGILIFLKAAYDLSKRGGTTTLLARSRGLVREGIYSCTRNPIYLSVFFISLGESAVFGSVPVFLYTFLLMMGLHLWVVLVEEPVLKKNFGREFDLYSAEVPRWVSFRRISTCLGRRRRSRSSPRSP